jgi:hypothetical protein
MYDTFGWDAYKGSYSTSDAAIKALKNETYDWAEVVDTKTQTVVWTEFGEE